MNSKVALVTTHFIGLKIMALSYILIPNQMTHASFHLALWFQGAPNSFGTTYILSFKFVGVDPDGPSPPDPKF